MRILYGNMVDWGWKGYSQYGYSWVVMLKHSDALIDAPLPPASCRDTPAYSVLRSVGPLSNQINVEKARLNLLPTTSNYRTPERRILGVFGLSLYFIPASYDPALDQT